MPSITAYSPYETLAFFQSIVQQGNDASAIHNISVELKQNEHIRDHANFDANRFSSESLRGLFNEYVKNDVERKGLELNGGPDSGERSPKRRKLSNSTHSRDAIDPNDEGAVLRLVDTLYTNYKNDTIRDIKKDEDGFARLREEIHALEHQIETQTKQQPQVITPQANDEHLGVGTHKNISDNGVQAPTARPASIVQEPKLSGSNSVKVNDVDGGNAPNTQGPRVKSPLSGETPHSRPLSTAPQPKGSQPPTPIPSQHQSPSTFPRHLPSSSSQRPHHGPMQSQPMYPAAQGAPGHLVPQVAGPQSRPLARGQQVGSQGRGSPVPYQGQPPYPQYQQYPPPQWHPHMPPQQFQQHGPYGAPPPYYPQPPNGRHPQTPQQAPYAPYPHTAPGPYGPPQQQWRNQQWPMHASAVTTPISRTDSRISLLGSKSSTPWKRRQHSTQLRPKTPPRPEREVSPLTDREESPVPSRSKRSTKAGFAKSDIDPPTHLQPRSLGRPQSVTPSAIDPSRSHSIASRTSDVQNDRHHPSRAGQKIKAEPPSTPVPAPSSDAEQRSSGRRGRPRSSTYTSQAEGGRTTITKRKRDSTSPASPARPSPASFAAPLPRRGNQSHDPALIIVSKNFAKTSQLLLNEITSHKLAGIFAKPLSERDAPGYKELVLRPQDLKSIKAAISKGNRAALAAIEAIEDESEVTPTRLQSVTASSSLTGAIGNGFFIVTKTSELVPPRGIVNSAQLEMELVRMFANAVMFNPLPSSERGLGKSLRLRKNGGDIDADIEPEDISTSEPSESGSSSGADEGGIISDAREMFNDVIEVVGKWRELEEERMGSMGDTGTTRHGSLVVPILPSTESGRHTSVSASSNLGEDENAAGESETASTPVPVMTSGPGRKRRRVAEH